MFSRMYELLEVPPAGERDNESFWTDDYISARLLDVHLDPNDDLASRKPDFMDKSVSWIAQTNPPERFPRLLDLGCGPGLYAQRFAKAGYSVTGIDFSQRSIRYARDAAQREHLPITYILGNYLTENLAEDCDLAVMIYCDYGALVADERRLMMQKVYRALRPGGRFLLDAHTMKAYDEFSESRTWERAEKGFWRGEKHLCLNTMRKYPPDNALHQALVITHDDIKRYNIWTHFFSPESLAAEAAQAGFCQLGIWGDAAGGRYGEDSTTLAILLEK